MGRCRAVTFGGIGGSFGSTTASISTGAGVLKAMSSVAAHSPWVLDGESGPAACSRECGEVDRGQIACELWIAEEDHLLPADLAQAVVLE
jgi:hypothetical protein